MIDTVKHKAYVNEITDYVVMSITGEKESMCVYIFSYMHIYTHETRDRDMKRRQHKKGKTHTSNTSSK